VKEFWVRVIPWQTELATTALEAGADALVVEDADRARALGRIRTVAPNGDLVPGIDIHDVEIRGKEDEERAADLAVTGHVIVRPTDWTVIPLENLVARSDRIMVAVGDTDEARLALGVLERGAAGVVLETDDPANIRELAREIRGDEETLPLIPFTVASVRPVGMGDRVCVDTCTLLGNGQGMLVGNSSSAFLLVHAETLDNPYVAARPFRVNAGAVHAYALMPGGKTAYLSEVGAGDHVSIVDGTGSTTRATVGRVKVERRPLLMVEAMNENGAHAGLVLQNAETVRLVTEEGEAVSVVDLAPGDRILGYTTAAGRHFGMAVDETIIER